MGNEEQILKFLTQHNKPFTVSDIVQGVDGIGKAKVQTCLTSLVEGHKVIEKTYGKQKIYCLAQLEEFAPNQGVEIERLTNALGLTLKEVEDNLEKHQMQLKTLEGTLNVQQAMAQKQTLEDEIKILEDEVSQSEGVEITKDERVKIEKAYNGALKEYRKRKRLCMDMIDAIFENYPKSKKILLQEIGLETDEDVHFSLNN